MTEQEGLDQAPAQSADRQESEMLEASQSNRQTKDTVKYESYRDAVSRGKKHQDRADNLEQELEAERQQRLALEGKKDELIESLRKQNADLQGKYQTAVGSFVRSKAFDVIVDEGIRLGCTSTRLLKKMVEDKLETLNYGEDFNPDREQVRGILQELKNEEPILFSKPAPKLGSHQINTDGAATSTPKKITELKDEDLLKMWEKSEKGN